LHDAVDNRGLIVGQQSSINGLAQAEVLDLADVKRLGLLVFLAASGLADLKGDAVLDLYGVLIEDNVVVGLL